MILNLTKNIQLTLPNHIIAIEYALIGLTFIVLCVALLLAYKRITYCRRFVLVALLNILSFFAVIGLISDIKVKAETDVSTILLTYGTSQQQIDSISKDEKTHVFLLSALPNWQSSLDLSALPNLLTIHHASEILLSQPHLVQLSVYGDGLTTQQWQMLNTLVNTKNHKNTNQQKLNVDFSPSTIRTGPIKLKWPKQLVLGQPFTIEGTFRVENKDADRIFKISLSDNYDELMDDFLIKNNEKFNLSATIKNQGLFTYQLNVFDDDQKLIVSEPVSFTVTSAAKINVVIKQSAASFESKHLKNWLAEQGEEVLVLTQVSKNKYIQQVVNATTDEKVTANTQQSSKSNKNNVDLIKKALTSTWLKGVDLLYMDGRSVLSLNKEEIAQLDMAIKQGLGLIIMVDDELLSSSTEVLSHSLLTRIFPQGALPVNTKNDQALTTAPRWLHSQEENFLKYINATLPTTSGKVLIEGSDGQPLWVAHTHGLGTATFSLINNSYQWLTSDKKSYYSQYWQYIIEQIARSEQQTGFQNSANKRIYFQGQAQPICVQENESSVNSFNVENINLLPSVVIDSAYCGVYLSHNLGWHNFSITNKDTNVNQVNVSASVQNKEDLNTLSIFVYSQQNWLAWQQLLKHEASNTAHKNSSITVDEFSYLPMDKLKFWWILFLASSLLWYERKTF